MLDIYEVDKLGLVFVAGSPSWLTYTNTPLAPAKQKWSSEGRRGEAGTLGWWRTTLENTSSGTQTTDDHLSGELVSSQETIFYKIS